MAFKVGDRVAIMWGDWVYGEDTIERTTPKQGVLKSGDRFKLEDGSIFGKYRKVSEITPEIEIEIQKVQAQEQAEKRLRRAQSRVRSAHDVMARGFYEGYSTEELEAIAEVMEGAIEALKQRKVQ